MQISQIAERIDQLASAWEQFKSVNDARLAQLEKKGSTDPLFDVQLGKIDTALNQYKERLAQLETAARRPKLGFKDLVFEDSEQQSSFNQYLRKGIEPNFDYPQHKSLSTLIESDGGYLVTAQMSKHIITSLADASIMRQLASIEEISTDSLDILEDKEGLEVGWVSETQVREDSKTPKFSKRRIYVHELYTQPKATQKLIDDASIDIDRWLSGKIAANFAAIENQAFIEGDGQGKPRGILSYKAGKGDEHVEQLIAGSGNFSADDILRLYYALDSKYAASACFLLHHNMLQTIRMLKDPTSGQYIWSPGLGLGEPDVLLGAKVKQSASMPLPVAGNIALAFADFKQAYKIVDRAAIRLLRDPFTDKPFVKFYTTKRVGGDVINFAAIKLLKFNAETA